MKSMTFYRWLMTIKNENLPMGHLARTVSLDNFHPRKNTLESWKLYLRAMSADPVVIDTLVEAWNRYKSIKSYPIRKCQTKIDHKNDKWLIQRPSLPSFWKMTPQLIIVGCDTKNVPSPTENNFTVYNDLVIRYIRSIKYCKALEQFGKYFRSEFDYDFSPYTVSENLQKGDERIQSFLFFNPHEAYDIVARPIGACGFLLQDGYEHWVMNWVWMHPYARRKGHLTKAWPYFLQRYKEFRILTPISNSMDLFLKKAGYRHFVR